jgi:hypothetical protein
MNGFSRPRSPKKFSNLWITLFIRLLSEGEIFTVGLGLPSKRIPQMLF